MVGIQGVGVRRLLACGLIAAVGITGAGCGSSKSKDTGELAPGAPIKVGYLASLSGFCAGFSQDYVKGAQQAVKTINAEGGVLGHPLQLLVRDDKAEPSVGVTQARDLVLSEHVKYLAGTCTSAVGKSVTRLVANPSHVPYVVGVADPTIFTGSGSYVFGTIPTANIEGANAAAFVRAHPQWKTVAVLAEDYSYGYEVAGAFRKAMQGSSQKILSQEYAPSGASSYSSYISKLVAEKPAVVYNTLVAEDMITFVKQAYPLGFFKVTQLFGPLDYVTIDAMTKPPVGALGYGYYPAASMYNTPLAKKLAPLGTAVANSGSAGDGFNQIQIIAQGIEQAKSTEPVAVRNTLSGATVQMVQGSEKIHACNNLTAVPIAMGPVVAATKELPFAHFSPIEFVDTSKYFTC
ncbi:MAG TPA: ABC transporter substrate-binding protein [Solirubrobacteraceae bacterium]|jgi:branched-chain amino acid transport system substrate-binding protein|nr:ABC transporter substrate-binding protein [Solirubrobacteraceae bacterium]